MELLLNADDFALTESGTTTILDCLDRSPLNGVSIVPNGSAFDYAVREVKKREDISIGVHLNVVEGRPVSEPSDIPMLVNFDGHLCHNFSALWRKLMFGTKGKREALLKQIRHEVDQQIQKCRHALGSERCLRLDSHTHVHMIPAIFDVLAPLVPSHGITYLRIPDERRISRACLSINGLKQVLLHTLSYHARKKLKGGACGYNSECLGVLCSGRMHQCKVIQRIDQLRRKQGVLEAIFHPGGGDSQEIKEAGIRFPEFYLSPSRDKEALALQSLNGHIEEDILYGNP